MSIRFIPVALVVGLVGLIAAGGAALAIGSSNSSDEQRDDLLERAASELGINSTTLKDAFDQASDDLEAERRREILEDLVASEVITQVQADEADAWMESMPDAAKKLARPDILFGLGADVAVSVLPYGDFDFDLHGSYFHGPILENVAEILGIELEDLESALENAHEEQAEDRRAELIDKLIDRLVEDGEITEAEGAEIKAWLDRMPEWLTEDGVLFDILSGGIAGMHSGGIAIPELFDWDGPHHFEFGPHGTFGPFGQPGEPFFGFPEGGDFGISPFEFHFEDFRMPDDSAGGFFFDFPEGDFEFNGELPPAIKELLERLDTHPFFDYDMDEPESDDESTSAVSEA